MIIDFTKASKSKKIVDLQQIRLNTRRSVFFNQLVFLRQIVTDVEITNDQQVSLKSYCKSELDAKIEFSSVEDKTKVVYYGREPIPNTISEYFDEGFGTVVDLSDECMSIDYF